MLSAIDGWTLAHILCGFLIGRIRVKRLLAYTTPIIWEVYQLYFHYQPQGKDVGYVWLNSVVDILAFIAFYEISVTHNLKHDRNRLWCRLNDNAKAILAYILISFAAGWLFWDDLFRLELAMRMPSPQIPLLIGAFSPAIASFLVRTWISRERLANGRLWWALRERRFYYGAFGLLPSITLYMVMKQVMVLPF